MNTNSVFFTMFVIGSQFSKFVYNSESRGTVIARIIP